MLPWISNVPSGGHRLNRAVLWGVVCSCLILSLPAPALGDVVRVYVSRDTWVSAAPGETDANLGGAPRLKVKSIQEMSIVDIDPADHPQLAGRVIRRATLMLHHSGGDPLRRVTVSTLAGAWTEGDSWRYATQPGAASFAWARQGRRRWAYGDSHWGPAGDLTAVALGQGHTLWRFAEATPPDRGGWQAVAVEPAVVAGRLAGLSEGFVVVDDTGSEYARDGEQFTYFLFPNRYVSSRDAGRKYAPYFVLELGDADRSPPEAVTGLRGEAADLPAGEALVQWRAPADRGPAGVLGYEARYSLTPPRSLLWDRATPLPRYLIPMAAHRDSATGMHMLHLRDLPIEAGAEVTLAVRAVDAAGNRGPVQMARITTSSLAKTLQPQGQAPQPLDTPPAKPVTEADLPTVGGVRLAVVDALDKVQAVTGQMIPEQPAGYLHGNHLWSASRRVVRLHAARNEFVSFQLLLSTADQTPRQVQLDVTFGQGDDHAPVAEISPLRCVPTRRGPLPDPLTPAIEPGQDITIPPADHGAVQGQRYQSVLVDLYVPHQARSQANPHTAAYRGTLTVTVGDETLSLPIHLHVWDFTLPDHLSFVPQMNCYGLPGKPGQPLWLAYYRMAHRHRTCLNRLPYNWQGRPTPGHAPTWDANRQQFDFTEYDRRFGALLDGAAFADLPRAGVPVDAFYLPLNENWPMDLETGLTGVAWDRDAQWKYWVDQALTPKYREQLVTASRRFAKHIQARGWSDTMFEFYLNNKVYYKREGWRRSSALWILDEPTHTQDFWALRWFGQAFHEGVATARSEAGDAWRAKLAYRCDISRPQWQRDLLDGVMDVNVVGGSVTRYRRMVMDRKRAFGEVAYGYGSANAVADANVQPAAWCVSGWGQGLDGVIPWQTIGRADSWKKDDPLSLFYPGKAGGYDVAPMPSIRLKAFRRGQQDVEYLTLLQQVLDQPRWRIGETVQVWLTLDGAFEQTSSEDAGVVRFDQIKPQDLWRLRTRVGAMLHAKRPAPKRRLIGLRPPPRDPAALPDLGHVTTPPGVAAAAAVNDTQVLVIQGKPAVRDAIIAQAQPNRPLGAVPRDNRIMTTDGDTAFLLHFDLDALPADAAITQATLGFYVWDPNNLARARIALHRLTAGDWDERAVTWRKRNAANAWARGSFNPLADADPAPVTEFVVEPELTRDTLDPPALYQIDLTMLVRDWASGRSPNQGLVLTPRPDRRVDRGHQIRFQVLASEYRQQRDTPKLTVRYRRP